MDDPYGDDDNDFNVKGLAAVGFMSTYFFIQLDQSAG